MIKEEQSTESERKDYLKKDCEISVAILHELQGRLLKILYPRVVYTPDDPLKMANQVVDSSIHHAGILLEMIEPVFRKYITQNLNNNKEVLK